MSRRHSSICCFTQSILVFHRDTLGVYGRAGNRFPARLAAGPAPDLCNFRSKSGPDLGLAGGSLRFFLDKVR
jgi:hypothetical protein